MGKAGRGRNRATTDRDNSHIERKIKYDPYKYDTNYSRESSVGYYIK